MTRQPPFGRWPAAPTCVRTASESEVGEARQGGQGAGGSRVGDGNQWWDADRLLSGIVTGILLAVARVMGETAPLLILVGYAQSMNFDIFSGFMGSLPGMMYDQTSAGAGVDPVPTHRLWGAALTLILVIATINIGARVIAKFLGAKKS